MAYYNGKGIGTGQKGHSGGHGKGQSGQENWGGGVAKKGASYQLANDGPKGGCGYQKDAHSSNYHCNGEAVGHLTDNQPMHYSNKLHGEGNSEIHTSGSYTQGHHSMGVAHTFPNNKSENGFGHSAAQMKGPLRMSGHPKAHRIGHK